MADEEQHPEEVLREIETKNMLRKYGKRILIGFVAGASVGVSIGYGIDVNRRLNILGATQVAILQTLEDAEIIQNLKIGK